MKQLHERPQSTPQKALEAGWPLQIYLKSSLWGQDFPAPTIGSSLQLREGVPQGRNEGRQDQRRGRKENSQASVGSPPESWIRKCSLPWAAHQHPPEGNNELSAVAGTTPSLLIRSNHFEDVRILKKKFEFQGSKSKQYNGA